MFEKSLNLPWQCFGLPKHRVSPSAASSVQLPNILGFCLRGHQLPPNPNTPSPFSCSRLVVSVVSKHLVELRICRAYYDLFHSPILVFYSVMLYYNHNVYYGIPAVHRFAVNGDQTYSWKLQDNLKWIEVSHKTTRMPRSPNKTLDLCPEMPPRLEGPLKVEFNTKRTLESVKAEASYSLQMGGRYKPSDCISRHKVAVIIPFRNRHEHLVHWLYYMHPILIRQQLDYGVYILNQDGEGIFNRAKLMNVGFVEAQKEYDYDCFVFSDVDLVPLDDRNIYRCYDNPRHLAVAMDKRIIFRGMSISRPDGVTGKYRMVRHQRDKHNEPNPENPGKLSRTKETMDNDGLNTLSYTVKEISKDLYFTFITVDIHAPAS
uniref:Beta-1,4-galactosyltransferase n=1 Tax=Xiphophorus couchianus TaxID=32473 RepID=A0A3B5LC26_9TELE